MSKLESADALEGDELLDDFVDGIEEAADLVISDVGSDAEESIKPSTKRKAVEAADNADKPKKKVKTKKQGHGVDASALFAKEALPLHDCSASQLKGDDHFSSFIRDFLFPSDAAKFFSKSSNLPPGAPKVLVLASSAIRAVEVCRLVRKTGDCKVAKLFAKHMKLKDQVEVLKKDTFPIAVGTPNRIQKLISDGGGALRLDELDFVIADGTHKDRKERTLFDVPEIRPRYRVADNIFNQI
ncbi:hypothetical protein SpCBS45565_g00839 [Spizellomyces sp. 'palustris']|nr:hypothetical protein SpCBS45565_g00839 [Spizellomyces sp. 'palustris']